MHLQSSEVKAMNEGGICEPVLTPVNGNSLAGILFSGDEVPIYPITCRTPQKQDLLVFRTEIGGTKYIKQIWGLPGSTLTIVDKNRVDIDGARVRVPDGRDLRLTRLQRMTVGDIEGRLEGYYVIGVPGSLDSNQFGVVPTAMVIGSVPKADVPRLNTGQGQPEK